MSTQDPLAVFQDAAEPVLLTSEGADLLPTKRRGRHDRLTALVEADVLVRKRIGKRTVYRLPGYTDTPQRPDSSEVTA